MKKKKLILDMGAANIPYPHATHAVDLVSKRGALTDEFNTKNDYYNGEITKQRFENMLKYMDYKFNFNYNTQKLPWPNNYFDIIFSNGSIGAYGKENAYKEAYRVLKHGGKLKFTVGEPMEKLQKKGQMLTKIGFTKVHLIQAGTYMYKGEKMWGGFMVATKP
jgi:ubiquinone/menaquinone biosynthesis C-methylase UbiE